MSDQSRRTDSCSNHIARSCESLERRRMMSAAADDPAPDTTAPTVEAVFVNGTDWSAAFRTYLGQNNLGSAIYGFQTDNTGSSGGGLRSGIIPWINVDQVSIRFSENVVVQEDDLEVRGVRSGVLEAAEFAYDPLTFTATWTFDEPLTADLIQLRLDGDSDTGVTDTAGNPLDADTSGSGGAPQGHDFRLLLRVLPGDVTRNGSVVANDFSEVKQKFFASTTNVGTGNRQYSIFHDVDGSGAILANDFSEVKNRFFGRLPDDDGSLFA
jgi:hypothetical protein